MKKVIIENIVRLSENSLSVNINRFDLSIIKIIYCIEQILNNSFKICSRSNTFNQLIPASIYNISVTIHRESFQNSFVWQKQTVFKLVNTSNEHFHMFILIHFSFL
jgi:hypothetical protein